MEFNYDGKHQVSFWKMTYLPWESSWECDEPRYSWDDLHLIPSAVPTVEIPKPNYSIVSIPGTSLRRDVTEYLPGGMTYSSVSGKWTFIVDHTQCGDEKSWIAVHRDLEDYFDGERFAVELTDDPGVLYSGRVWISDHEAGDNYSTITVEYDFGVGEFDLLDGLYFKIRFLDFNGEVLQEELMKYGEMPVYYRQRPEKDRAEFIGWEPEIAAVTGTADYTAIYEYEGRSHSIIFYDAAGNVIHEEYDVPDWMKFVHYTMHPLIETMGPRNALLNNIYRKPENMEFLTEEMYRTIRSIRVIVPPYKVDYDDDDEMRYAGIQVMGYDTNGDAVALIPYNELIFPTELAQYDYAKRTGWPTFTADDPFYIEDADVTYDMWDYAHGSAGKDYFDFYRREAHKINDGPAIVAHYSNTIHFPYHYGPITLSTERDNCTTNWAVYGGTSSITIDEIVWFFDACGWVRNSDGDGRLGGSAPELDGSGAYSENDWILLVLKSANAVVTSTSTDTILVRWKRPVDNVILSDSFQISVTKTNRYSL